MLYSEMLKHYTKEYEKYVEMGLSKDDALTLVEKHIKADTNIKKASPYDLINLFAGEDVWKSVFEAYQKELDNLFDKVTKVMGDDKEKCEELKKTIEDTKEVVSETKNNPVCCGECGDCVKKEVIADTPKHKEFRVTYPNGYYKYKMLVK